MLGDSNLNISNSETSFHFATQGRLDYRDVILLFLCSLYRDPEDNLKTGILTYFGQSSPIHHWVTVLKKKTCYFTPDIMYKMFVCVICI